MAARGTRKAAAANQSDEEQDIDIESDDDDYVGSPSSAKDGSFDTNDKKAHHNALERKRRDHIKESFDALRDSLPTIRKEKVSRAQTLQQATDYIRHMTQKNSMIQKDIDTMRKQNQDLKQKVLMAEKNQPVVLHDLTHSGEMVTIEEQAFDNFEQCEADSTSRHHAKRLKVSNKN